MKCPEQKTRWSLVTRTWKRSGMAGPSERRAVFVSISGPPAAIQRRTTWVRLLPRLQSTVPLPLNACPRGGPLVMRLLHLVLLFTAASLVGCSRRTEEEPFLVGHVTPLSGRDRLVGEHVQRGMQLALEDANEIPIAGRRV